MANTLAVEPSILEWARQSAGLTLSEASKKLGLTTKTIEDLENGQKHPTQQQLIRFSEKYVKPLTVFYLSAPPAEPQGARIEDFRSFNEPVHKRDAATLDQLLQRIRVGQSYVRELLEDDDDSEPLSFLSTIDSSMSVSESARRVANLLSVDASMGAALSAGRKISTPSALFKELRDRVERLGVFVLLAGDLGSHHTSIDPDIFRGYALVDPYAPYIVINTNDAEVSRSFTLLHELAHLFLGQSGISGQPADLDSIHKGDTTQAIEKYCNDIAAEILLPQSSLPKSILKNKSVSELQDEIEITAKTMCVSEPNVAYRLMQLKRISSNQYRGVYRYYVARWQAAKERKKRNAGDTPINPNVVKRSRLGNALPELVGQALKERTITTTSAAKILRVSAGSVTGVLDPHREKRAN